MQVKAAIYCRISKDRTGGGLGVDRQRQDCQELADKLGWTVVATYTDNDLSAYSSKPRPGYSALLDDIRSQRVNAVLAWHSDRLHRSPTELEEYINTCEAGQVPTQCVTAGTLDLTTPSGRLVARQLGVVARYEVEHMVERQKRAKLQSARAGQFRGGRRAFGYERDGVTVRPAEAEIVAEMASRVLAGESVRSIAFNLNERGSRGTFGGEWTGAAVRDVLIKARTAGLVEHHGEVVAQAVWPALLAEDVWRGVRAILTAPGRSHGKSGARVWLLSGLAVCGLPDCGLPVRIAVNTPVRGGQRLVFNSYRCSGRAVHVSRAAERVDRFVQDTVIARLSRPDAVALLRPRNPLVDITALHGRANGIRAQLDELASLWARKVMNASQFATASAELNAELNAVERQIDSAATPSPLHGLVGAVDVAAVWDALSLDRQRAVVDELMDVTILPGKRGRKTGGIYFDPETVHIDWKID